MDSEFIYSENDCTILTSDELVDTRDGYTWRVVAFNPEHNKFWTRCTGIRESNWNFLYEGDDEETNLRMQYAEVIASLCTMQGLDVPQNIKMYLPGYMLLPDEPKTPESYTYSYDPAFKVD